MSHDITTSEQLRALYREPHDMVKAKKGATITGAMARFVAASPFFCLATAHADGTCDVSPRGGPAGQLRLLDEGRSVAFPDLSGNNLLDSLSNLVSNPRAGLLVMVPGSDETLRIDGPARLTTDPEILGLWDDELRTPKLAVVVEVTSAFLHCAKAYRRSGNVEARHLASGGRHRRPRDVHRGDGSRARPGRRAGVARSRLRGLAASRTGRAATDRRAVPVRRLHARRRGP